MAGITQQGMTIKRQGEVIEDLKERAVPIFQDLVPENDFVDTSDDSTIGRLIGLNSLALADLWELAQQVYLAFDPNSAYGVALDNLVQYAGLTRSPGTATTVPLVVWGDENTSIFAIQNLVRAGDNTLYEIANTVELDRNQNIGVRMGVGSITEGESHSLSILTGSVTLTVDYTAQAGDTAETILGALQTQLTIYPFLRTELQGDSLVVESVDIYESMSVSFSGLTLLKVKGRTEGRSQQVGPIEQDRNSITQIATPVLGWDSVNNPVEGLIGRNEETDEELRERFRTSKFLRAQNIADSLYSALFDIEGVTYVTIYDNDEDTYNAEYDLPPHSFKAVIQGGFPPEIANVIWRNKPLGIAPEGNTTEFIIDSQGFPREMKWDRPIGEPIYITMDITQTPNFPVDGVQRIKADLVEYFRTGMSIGTDVIYSRLYTPINRTQGFQIDSMYIGDSPNPTGTTNINIPYNGIATINSNDIVINVL